MSFRTDDDPVTDDGSDGSTASLPLVEICIRPLERLFRQHEDLYGELFVNTRTGPPP